MTATTTTVSAELEELSAAELLACVSDVEAAERRAGLGKLELGLQWCVLHPATDESGVAVWGDAGLPGMTGCEEALGGAGCPWVAAYAPEPFAAALGVSTWAGMQLLADALDLAHRLPLAWRRVRALEVPAWRARRLAQDTRHLSARAAAYVDSQVADRLHSCGGVLIDRYVAQAAARFDPAIQAEAEHTGQRSWDVTLSSRSDGRFAATSQLEAVGDTLDLTKFYDLVCDRAAHLGRLGDTDDLGARKAKALGVIADAQTHFDLDHIEPYLLPPDQGGPPGQTAASKFACLCRRHHNAKTSRRWRYQANPDGTYTWHSPHGLSYLVTPHGTTPLPPA